MSQRTVILNKFKLSKSELNKFGVVHIGLFGSVNLDEYAKSASSFLTNAAIHSLTNFDCSASTTPVKLF